MFFKTYLNILQINLQSLTASLVYLGYFIKSKLIQEFLKKGELQKINSQVTTKAVDLKSTALVTTISQQYFKTTSQYAKQC